MKKGYTRVAVILDRSGSMSSCKETTIGAFNNFVSEQQKLPGTAKLKLVQFDSNGQFNLVAWGGTNVQQVRIERPAPTPDRVTPDVETMFDGDLKLAPVLTDKTFVPRGSTPLLDAIGKTVDELGAELRALPEYQRPESVVVVILTDGQENASHVYNREEIKQRIEHQTAKYNWTFLFLGANFDAVTTASSYGIAVGSSMQFSTADPLAYAQAMSAVNCSVASVRTTGSSPAFTPEQRKSSMGTEDTQNSGLAGTITDSKGNVFTPVSK